MKQIKVIKIDNNRFFHEMLEGGIKTTNHIKNATDISNLNYSVISWIMKGLKDRGHTVKIVDYIKK
ncbi:hypothetical protein PQE70_gp238 [Bacillus phage vB_BanS_Nate]|uniref:Uncharacterized protein n=1 Tax=Bacillus phage vB_BanS_Nate TaxID=2894788 RepID=A0AAE9CDU5_9CAUD|nr:hypothetical protein PQE70_gp238 [Bacillus phage vB_BanS_Nate]UGO51120.1 hypothetical protein NATE_286 [Bacillus phage vB_BanS_Nate]